RLPCRPGPAATTPSSTGGSHPTASTTCSTTTSSRPPPPHTWSRAMPLDPAAIGRPGEPYAATWSSRDCLLYAVGVGAGVDELAFTTENTEGVEQRVLPTFAVAIGAGLEHMPDFGTYDLANLVHAEQRITLHQPIP